VDDFKPLRYDEDYSFLRTDTTASWYKKMKYFSFNKQGNSYISFGGDLRYQYYNIKNEGWGEEPEDKDGFVYTRFLVHADVHLGKRVRGFAQLQSSLVTGKMTTNPLDENPLGFHQAFIDINTLIGSKSALTFRFGRQELLYGSQRLISSREGPNNRQSFDGIKSIFIFEDYKADFFFTHHVAVHKGVFDDGFNKDVKLWGAYIVKKKFPPSANIDLYYLGLWKRNTTFDDGQEKELRHSIGSRVWGSGGNWQYDVEGLYQFGNFGDKNISAWTTSLNTSYTFDKIISKPKIALKTELISGDLHHGDNRLETFNALFPRGGYFGLAALIGPANLVDIHPAVSLTVTSKLGWNVDYDVFWRYSNNDGIYAPNVALIYSGKAIVDKYIGQQFSSDFVYAPNPFLNLTGEILWFNTGQFLKKAGSGKGYIIWRYYHAAYLSIASMS
jgi:hypothetical protein